MVGQRPVFPDPRGADATGLVAVTQRLDVDLLLEAYSHGIFPWSEHPVRWYSPDPRAIFLRDRIHLPRRLGRTMRKHELRVTFDTAFVDVMRGCSASHRDGGVWITPGFVRAYNELHQLGYAHSVEVWQGINLVGGLYGIQLGGLFAGESMFHTIPDASKVAFAHLVAQLDIVGTVLFDCQVINDHTARLGAVCVHRDDYLMALAIARQVPGRFAGEKWPAEPPPPAQRTPHEDDAEGELAPGQVDAAADDARGDDTRTHGFRADGETTGAAGAADARRETARSDDARGEAAQSDDAEGELAPGQVDAGADEDPSA